MKRFFVHLKFAAHEIWNNRRFSLLFCIQLSLGLCALAIVDGLRESVQGTLHERSKSLLAADISVGARRPLTENEEQELSQLIPKNSDSMTSIETFTMLASAQNTRLVELKSIETAYPFYGNIELRHGGLVSSDTDKDLFRGNHLWVTPELAMQLKIDRGSVLKIGGLDFTVTDIVERDASSIGSGFSFAPTVYLSAKSLERTGLIATGSTGYFERLYRIPEGTDVQKLANQINETLVDPGIRVKLPDKASEQVGRGLTYLTDYLALSSLVALFTAALGIIYLLRRYLYLRRALVGTLKALGVRGSGIFVIYLSEVIILGLCASVLAVTVAGVSMPLLSPLLGKYLGLDMTVKLPLGTIVMIFSVATILSALLSLPLLLQFSDTRPRILFQSDPVSRGQIRMKYALWYTPAVILTYVLAVWFSRSFQTGGIFFAAFWGSFIALSLIGLALFRLAETLSAKQGTLRLVLRQLLRERVTSLAVFVTLSVAFTLTSFIPQLKEGLLVELESPTGLNQPSLFLFDIQDEQLEPLRRLVEENGSRVMQSSPMIRARLEQVNGQPFQKRKLDEKEFTREEENENRFRNRGFNLTYRQELTESETLISGRAFSPASQGSIPEVSLEQRFAKRLDLGIGDKLTFDIQGIPIEALVVSLRKVRWTSFQPNFFIQFAEGILQDAPKTHLLTLPAMSMEKKMDLQNQVIDAFPNVSIIDVTKLVERLSELLNQMSVTLQILALVTLIVGAFILFTVATFMAEERKADVAIMKAIGVKFRRIQSLFIFEFSILVFLASLFGILISIVMAGFIGRELFDGSIKATWTEWAILMIGGLSAAAAVIYLASTRTLRRTTVAALREKL